MQLLENGDLGVILARGQKDRLSAHSVPHDAETATVMVLLDVDSDHHEVHFSHRSGLDAQAAITQALETLVTCRHALMKVRKP